MNAYQAINSLLSHALREQNVHVLGEALELDPATQGLIAQAPQRVHLLPAADASLVGVGIGLALSGARPVITLSGPDALWGAIQQLGQEAAPLRTVGEFAAPVVLRVPVAPGEAISMGLLERLEGIVVASPSTPGDAVSMLRAALASDRPVVLLEPREVLSQQMVDTAQPTPLVAAHVVRPGAHASVLAWGAGVASAISAAEALDAEGISVEVIDLRTINPLDRSTIAESVSRTGRPIVAGAPEGVLLSVVQSAFLRLESPPTLANGGVAALTQAIRSMVHY